MVSNGSGSSGDGSGKAKIKFQEIKARRIFRQLENECGKTYAPAIFTPGDIIGIYFC
jgi:hypothetical protein